MRKNFLSACEAILSPHNILLEDDVKRYASKDQSTNVEACMPLVVLIVESIEQLINITKLCINYRMPLVIRAAGTGKSGGAVPFAHSIVIDTRKLNNIISIDKRNLIAELEPGVIIGEFQHKVKKQGLFYPPDPASSQLCTIGGNIAENAGGPNTLKYGATREYFLGGQAVLGTGEVINFGKRCPKGVSGYDVASILCGSEGTLAVLTKIIVRLLPLPCDQAQGLFYFNSEEEALDAVSLLFNRGHRPKILEYIDQTCLKALNKTTNLIKSLDKAALLIECDASFKNGARLQLEAIRKSLNHESHKAYFAYDFDQQQEIRLVRTKLSQACSDYLGYKISEDIALPLAQLANFRRWFIAQAQTKLVRGALFGHAGDGNLHVQILFGDMKFYKSAQALRHDVLLKVLELGGTLSAEHGIGLQKKNYLILEQQKELIELQIRIKKAFDPYNLLNPGKIFVM